MAFEQHQRTDKGRFRRERADSSMEQLKKEYPVLNNLHGNIKTLGGAERALGVDSLSKVIEKARRMK